MARCAAYFNAQNGNSTTLPLAGLMAVAGQDLIVREVGLFNDGTTAFKAKLVRITAAGTTANALTEANIDFANHTILGTAFGLWSAAPTLGADVGAMPVGAAIGAGTILTFYGDRNGILVPAGTGNGVGIIQTAAVSQAASGYIIWDE
jgi:hypothetical protein